MYVWFPFAEPVGAGVLAGVLVLDVECMAGVDAEIVCPWW